MFPVQPDAVSTVIIRNYICVLLGRIRVGEVTAPMGTAAFTARTGRKQGGFCRDQDALHAVNVVQHMHDDKQNEQKSQYSIALFSFINSSVSAGTAVISY